MKLIEYPTKPLKSSYGTFPLYINPTKNEILSIVEKANNDETIRFICDYKNKKIYAFTGYYFTHDEVAKELNISYKLEQTNYLFLYGNTLTNDIKITIKNKEFMNSLLYEYIFTLKSNLIDDTTKLNNTKYTINILNKDWTWLYEWVDKKQFEKEQKYILNIANKILLKLS